MMLVCLRFVRLRFGCVCVLCVLRFEKLRFGSVLRFAFWLRLRFDCVLCVLVAFRGAAFCAFCVLVAFCVLCVWCVLVAFASAFAFLRLTRFATRSLPQDVDDGVLRRCYPTASTEEMHQSAIICIFFDHLLYTFVLL